MFVPASFHQLKSAPGKWGNTSSQVLKYQAVEGITFDHPNAHSKLMSYNPLCDPSELNPRWNRARNKAWMAACVAIQVFQSEKEKKKIELEIPREVADIYADILLAARTCAEAFENKGVFSDSSMLPGN